MIWARTRGDQVTTRTEPPPVANRMFVRQKRPLAAGTGHCCTNATVALMDGLAIHLNGARDLRHEADRSVLRGFPD